MVETFRSSWKNIKTSLIDSLPVPDHSQLLDFNTAALTVLGYLHERLRFDLWIVTRTEGSDWIILQANDQGYGIKAGDVLSWTDSFCSRMVNSAGPRIAPCSDEVAAHIEAPIGQ